MPETQNTTSSSQRLQRWHRGFNPVVVVAAILPLGSIIADDTSDGPGAIIAFGCWLVFAVDFVVRLRLGDHFLRTWKGKTYLAVVLVTFPVYPLIPALDETDVLAVARLGWVAVLAVAGAESARDLRLVASRIGTAGLYASAAVLVAAMVVYQVEDPEDGFVTFGDGVWWAVATITTVGYGDRVPATAPGRFAATLLMISGLAFLGVVAASLASYFGLGDDDAGDSTTPDRRDHDEVLSELRALRKEVAGLRPQGSLDDARPGGGDPVGDGDGT